MPAVPNFDQIYVISDLHLGGRLGFQIFGSTDELVWLLTQLRDDKTAARVALVINGDFVDFLAEEPPKHFDPEGAADKLNRIAREDTNFKKVFTALRDYFERENNSLVINLGNHDLELALPTVREQLTEILTGNNASACARLHYVFDGTGVRLDVGPASVLCLHGNETDNWNFASYETIRQIGRDLQLGRPIKEWIPNPGARMVIDAMNIVKRQFPFVDLLKPEQEAVIPAIRACDIEGKLGAAWGAGRAFIWQTWTAAWKPDGMLSSDQPSKQGWAEQSSLSGNRPTGNESASFGLPISDIERARFAERMLLDVEALVERQVNPRNILGGAESSDLGWIFKERSEDEASESLREALRKLDEDRSFDPGARDECFTQLDEKVAPTIDFVIAGHTHLRRALSRTKGAGHYFNSGTWARLIQIKPADRNSRERFLELFKTLKGDMETLDKSNLAMSQRTVVKIWREDDNRVYGQLLEVSNGPNSMLSNVDDAPRRERGR